MVKLKTVAEPIGYNRQDLPGLRRDFRADAVTIQNYNRCIHSLVFLLKYRPWFVTSLKSKSGG